MAVMASSSAGPLTRDLVKAADVEAATSDRQIVCRALVEYLHSHFRPALQRGLESDHL